MNSHERAQDGPQGAATPAQAPYDAPEGAEGDSKMSERIGQPPKDNPGLGPRVRQKEHLWSLVVGHASDDGSRDTVDACTSCGTVRHTYEHRGRIGQGYPRYFGNIAQHMTVEDAEGMPEACSFWGTTEELPCRIVEW